MDPQANYIRVSSTKEVTLSKYSLRRKDRISYLEDDKLSIIENTDSESVENVSEPSKHKASKFLKLTNDSKPVSCYQPVLKTTNNSPSVTFYRPIYTKENSELCPNRVITTTNNFSKFASSKASLLPADKNTTSCNDYDHNDSHKNYKNPRNVSYRVPSLFHTVNDTDMDAEDLSSKFHFDLFSNQNKDISPEILQITYKYECFQLNCNDLSSDVKSNAKFDSESEVYSKNYFSCFKQAKKYFNKVMPLLSKAGSSNIELEYDSCIDDLPNYNDFTELELSLLQKVSCGCKPLTWDEYEKMHLSMHKTDTEHFSYLNSSESFSTCNGLQSDNLKSGVEFNRKFVIKDSKFHFHPSDTESYTVFVNEPCIYNDEDDKAMELDPLVLNSPVIEMVDKNTFFTYETLETDAEVMQENIEFLPFHKEEINDLKARLNSFKLNDAGDLGNGWMELNTMTDEETSNSEEPVLQAHSISEAEFSACNTDEVSRTDNSVVVEDILSSAISQEFGKEVPFISPSSDLIINDLQSSNTLLSRRNSTTMDTDAIISEDIPIVVAPPSASGAVQVVEGLEGTTDSIELLIKKNISRNDTTDSKNIPNTAATTTLSERSSLVKDVEFLIETASSLLASNATEFAQKSGSSEISDIQFPLQIASQSEVLSFDKSVANQIVGKILSNDDIKLLSQYPVNKTDNELSASLNMSVSESIGNAVSKEISTLAVPVIISGTVLPLDGSTITSDKISLTDNRALQGPSTLLAENSNSQTINPHLTVEYVDTVLTELLRDRNISYNNAEENAFFILVNNDSTSAT